MARATVIYPHQLFAHSPALARNLPVYIVEEPLLLTCNPAHRQRLMLHKLSMDAYGQSLRAAGHRVIHLSIHDHPTTASVFSRLRADGIDCIEYVDTADCWLERALSASGLRLQRHESPMFLLAEAEAADRYRRSGRFMASFYRQLRLDHDILVERGGKPAGGKWSHDSENRQRIPGDAALPGDPEWIRDVEVNAAADWVDALPAPVYGAPGCWLPWTHEGASRFLDAFLEERLEHFGPYEDALHTGGVRLWHSSLSPPLNLGLLTPGQVLKRVLDFAMERATPLNSLEGFVRQVLGWREFIRASYVVDGSRMRTTNHFQHRRPLQPAYWTGDSGLFPVDFVIRKAMRWAYTHHIERLMVMGCHFLLTETDPDAVYAWFMGSHIDAYDWVMVPNVYGMSQFADGGLFATKPYICGSAYLRKMSNYPKGEWEAVWTALYWRFIEQHRDILLSNQRTAMLPRLFDRMAAGIRSAHLERAGEWLRRRDPTC